MRIVCILLAVVSAALSLFNSGASTIVGCGSAEASALPPEILYAVVAAIFAAGGAFLLYKKKKFAAIPLFIATAVQAWANLRVVTPYPYLLASVALYAFAGLGSLMLNLKDGIEKEIEDEIFGVEEKPAETEAENSPAADVISDDAPMRSENSESEIETEIFDDEKNTAENSSQETAENSPDKETEILPDETAETSSKALITTPKKKRWRLHIPRCCSEKCLLLGVLLAMFGAGISLHFSDVWQQISDGSIKLTSLKEFLALDPLSSRVIGAAAIALLAALFHLGRKTFSAILFFAAAGILASLQYGSGIEYPHWQAGIFLYLLAAFRAEYVGIDAMKNDPPRRYTWAYVYGFALALGASFIALRQSGICAQLCASDELCAISDAFLKMDGGMQTVALIAALGIFGGGMALLMLPSASWVLLGAMLLGLLAEIGGAMPFAYSWLVVLLLAIAGLCSASSVRIDAPLPVKRLTLACAFFLMVLAGVAGSALTLYVTKGQDAGNLPAVEAEIASRERDENSAAEEEVAAPEGESEINGEISAPEDESEIDGEISASDESQPAENDERIAELEKQLLMLMTESDAKIAELENQLEALSADGDEQVKNLASQLAEKEEEVKKLTSAAAEGDAKIAELENQIEELSAGSDEQVKKLTAQLSEKDEEIEKLTAAAAENEAKISDLEKQLKDSTAGSDEQVKKLTAQSAEKDEEIEKLTAAATENEAKISDLEKQIKDSTAGSDEQVKKVTSQLSEKDEEIEKLTAAATENEAKISELEKQLKDSTAGSDEQVKKLTAQLSEKDEEIKKLTAAVSESDGKISSLQYQLEAQKLRGSSATIRYICVRGRANVRSVPNANAGSKIVGVIRDEIKEVLEVTHPEGSSGDWYKVEYSAGTGWVFGGDAVFPFEVKK